MQMSLGLPILGPPDLGRMGIRHEGMGIRLGAWLDARFGERVGRGVPTGGVVELASRRVERPNRLERLRRPSLE